LEVNLNRNTHYKDPGLRYQAPQSHYTNHAYTAGWQMGLFLGALMGSAIGVVVTRFYLGAGL
jgi:hypothetical protein